MKRGLILVIVLFLTACTTSKNQALDQLNEVAEEIAVAELLEEDILLPQTEKYGVLISWESNREEILSTDGKIFPTEQDEEVILTAKLSLENQEITKVFHVIVKGVKKPIENINFTGEYQYQIAEEKATLFPYYKGHTYAGLYTKDGQEHKEFTPNETTGSTLSVKLFGAKADDEGFDNTPAFQKAITAAKPGDEIFVPAGKYYFHTAAITSPYYAHIYLKPGVNLRGAGEDKSILISSFQNKEYVDKSIGKKTATLACGNGSSCTISSLGFTANTDDSCLPPDYNDTKVNNPEGNQYAPAFGIVVYNTSLATLTQNIYIHNVHISYFQYDGIRLYCTRNCKISDSIITKATDIGGGGAGYGIEIRGYGHEYFKYVDTRLDSCYNIVEGVQVIGPYIRHGIILSYVTHNNLFYNNQVLDSADDAFDVHGQDEFLNVFSKNYAYGSRRGAGLGLGNTGSSHDESGYGNVLYQNVFENCKYGVTVARGTQYTQVIENTIRGCTYGVYINNGPNTFQKNNITE